MPIQHLYDFCYYYYVVYTLAKPLFAKNLRLYWKVYQSLLPCWTSWRHCRLGQGQTSFHLYFSGAWHRVGAQLNVCWSSVWSVSVPENLDSTEAPGVAWALLSSPVLGTCWVSETTRGALHAQSQLIAPALEGRCGSSSQMSAEPQLTEMPQV